MSPIKSILLHLDASPSSAQRLQVAMRLADRHSAAVTALYAVTPALMHNPAALAIASSPEVAPLLAEYDTERRHRTRAVFDKITAGRDRIHWLETRDDPTRAFARAALFSDLLVLGQRPPKPAHDADVPPDFAESVLMWSGKPALVLPHVKLPETIGRVALVAWKESRESARALAASLPLLQQAEQVHVMVWGDPADSGEVDTLPDVQTYLRRHGVHATLHRQTARPAEVGGLLLSQASDLSADLIVMGCYGHGRAREWVLGGATRTLLAAMTVPVLMVH